MANANTKHSKALRLEAAKKALKNQTAANRFEVRSKDTDKIAAIRAGLAEVEGADNADKLLNLINFYKDMKTQKL